MKVLKKALALLVILTMLLSISSAGYAADADTIRINPVSGLENDFIMGADVSMLNDIVKYGGKFYDIGSTADEDCLEIMKAHGVNWIRLRIWNDPVTDADGRVGDDTITIDGNPAPAGTPAGAGTCDEATTIAAALKAKALGMKILLDFHYSDFWADPGKQAKPKAWKDLTGMALQDAVYDYTRQVVQNMKDQGVMPDMIQIGNENNNGMMYPDGSIANGFAGWIGLINAASKAIREVGGTDTGIMIHLADGGNNEMYRRVFDHLTNFAANSDYVSSSDPYYTVGQTGIDFDVIGFSYYPFWHGTMEKFKQNMNDIAQRYDKEVAVAEIGYGYTFDNGDNLSNAFGEGDDELSGYQATVQGQAQFVRDVIEAVSQVKDASGNNVGIGVFYWEPDWIPVLDEAGNNQVGWITGGGNDSDNRALFDFTGHALPSLDVFNLVRKDVSQLPGDSLYEYEIDALRDSSIISIAGRSPDLPETVLAEYTDGTIRSVPVVWDKIESSMLSKLHTFSLNGSVEGTVEKAVLSITVIGKENYAQDPGFESGNLAAWTVTEDSPSDVNTFNENSPGGNAYTGENCFAYEIVKNASGFTVEQTITGLPDGPYILKVISHGADTAPGTGVLNRYLFAKDYGGDEKRVSFTNTGWRNWVIPEIENINVVGGTCTIGVRVDNAGSGTWGKLDDFELYPDLSRANLILPYSISGNSQFEAGLSYSKLINNIYAQDITINYDAGKVEYVSAAGATNGIKVTAVDQVTDGAIRILAANTNTWGLSWSADSLKLTFRSKPGANITNQDITISKALLGTSDGSIIEPAGVATIRADKPADSNTGSNTGSDTGSDPVQPKNGVITFDRPSVTGDTAIVNIGRSTVDNAFISAPVGSNGTRTVSIVIPAMSGLNSYEAVLPATNLAAGSTTRRIAISTGVGSINVPTNMLSAADTAGASTAGIRMAKADTSALSSDLKAQIGSRPVIELVLKIDGKTVSWNNPSAPVTVSIPYKPTAEELKDPEHIVVWYIDGSGKAICVPNGRYDPATGQVVFTTTHFSKYAVAYSFRTFSDLDKFGWAKNAIEVLASKGVIKDTPDGKFSPGSNITRSDFAMMLVNSLGLSSQFSTNFSDLKETDTCYEAAGIARKLGISSGTGNNCFSPDDCISRQDMMVMLQKALVVSGKISASGTVAALDSYSDRSAVAKYASKSIARLIGEGIVQGSGNAIRPKAVTSRAEAAVMIYRAANK
jgi:arabinogalactan endo-1,4-beta-galactosidase